MLSPSHSDLGARAAAWIRQHYPRRAAAALSEQFNIDERTAKRLLAGEASSRLLVLMATRFGESFRGFVFEGRQAPPAMAPVRSHWISDTGIYAAEDGLANFIRRRFGDSGESDADHIHYAVANLGWIAVMTHPGSVEFRFAEAVEENALRLARDWLGREAPAVISINGVGHPDHIAAMIALDHRIGVTIAREAMLAAPWRVIRHPLDAVAVSPLAAVLRSWHQQDGSATALLRALQFADGMRSAAVLRVDSGNVISIHAGDRLGVRPEEIIGRNVLDRRDQRYAAMIQAHALEVAKLRAPTFYDLDVDIEGRREKYRRVAIAAPPNPDGSVLVGTAVERVAA